MRIHSLFPLVLLAGGAAASAADFALPPGGDSAVLAQPLADENWPEMPATGASGDFEDDVDMSAFDGWADEPSRGDRAQKAAPSTPPTWLRTEPAWPGATLRNAPDLSGTWRGSGGERVEIRGDQARLWDGPGQMCTCYFLVFGDRLIAYSPATDVVRKFEFFREGDLFALRDQYGQVMMFERVR